MQLIIMIRKVIYKLYIRLRFIFHWPIDDDLSEKGKLFVLYDGRIVEQQE
jgi:hypothetical protein